MRIVDCGFTIALPVDISVVIPAYRGGHWRRTGIPVQTLLSNLLASLARQTLDASRFEVILVHTAPGDPADLAAAEFRDQLDLRLVRYRNVGGGASAARNVGWRQARASIVALIDGDCVADEGWLLAIRTRLAANQDHLGLEGLTRTERAGITPFTHQLENLTGGLFCSCNMAYRKSVLEQVDGFDEAFPYGHEDTDLSIRVQRIGPLPFCAEAVVIHPPIPTRPVQLIRRAFIWRNELILFHKDPADYLQRKHRDPLVIIYWHLGLVCLFDQLREHRHWFSREPQIYLAYVAALLFQRLVLLALLPRFVRERFTSPRR